MTTEHKPHSDHYVRAMESTAHRKEVRAGTLQAAREYADRENLTTGHVVRFANAYLSDALTYIDSIEEQFETAQRQAFVGAEALQWVAATYPKVIDRMPRALMRALREADAPYPASRQEGRMNELILLVREYDALSAGMDEHLAQPTTEDGYGNLDLPCGCVKGRYPDTEDRCDVFRDLARRRWAAHERIFELLREASNQDKGQA